jgi:hypothetical protein
MRNAVIEEQSNSIITASHRSFPKDHVVVGKWEFSPWKRQPVEYAKKKRQSRGGSFWPYWAGHWYYNGDEFNDCFKGKCKQIRDEEGDRFVWTVQYRIYVRDINEPRLTAARLVRNSKTRKWQETAVRIEKNHMKVENSYLCTKHIVGCNCREHIVDCLKWLLKRFRRNTGHHMSGSDFDFRIIIRFIFTLYFTI